MYDDIAECHPYLLLSSREIITAEDVKELSA
jgi:hypothetical protein